MVLDTADPLVIPLENTTAEGELLTIGRLLAPAVTVTMLPAIGPPCAVPFMKMTGPEVELSVIPPVPIVRFAALCVVVFRPKYVVPDASTVSEFAVLFPPV